MISAISTNIISPLGFTTEENYQAVLSGRSALRRYDEYPPLKGGCAKAEPFAASLFSEEQRAALSLDGYTFFEAIAIRSACEALAQTSLDTSSPRVVLLLSTTKGDIGVYPSDAAQRIARALGVSTTPIVVCNACVSGLSAQLLADYLLSADLYDYAIVVGAEVQSKFIVAGFQSLKAVSDEPCRPFDIERTGLNLGEAAATIIFKGQTPSNSPLKGEKQSSTVNSLPLREGWGASGGLAGAWYLIAAAARNDAFHIVSPSPQGDGCYKAIEAVMAGRDKSQLATVCVHGTATLFNDQMESKAIERAGLTDIPLSALKGYYGHTMGAAGVLETILTMRATDDGLVLPSKGFTELGVSGKVSISSKSRRSSKTSFLKLLSGFGGCNVAALFSRGKGQGARNKSRSLIKKHTISLSSKDGKSLTDIYKQEVGDYPKFYKMDILTRLAFLAAELLKKESLPIEGEAWKGSPLILFNHSSSIVSDRQFLTTISDDNLFPSPSVFVYTLPNITAGEVAIRHHINCETSFYILPKRDEALMQQILEATLSATGATSALSGWVDAKSETSFECELSIYEMNNEEVATAL